MAPPFEATKKALYALSAAQVEQVRAIVREEIMSALHAGLQETQAAPRRTSIVFESADGVTERVEIDDPVDKTKIAERVKASLAKFRNAEPLV